MSVNIGMALEAVHDRCDRLPAVDRLTAANELIEELRVASARLGENRRAAVREMRADGSTLREIADALGVTTARVYQLEIGYDRTEKRRRAAGN